MTLESTGGFAAWWRGGATTTSSSAGRSWGTAWPSWPRPSASPSRWARAARRRTPSTPTLRWARRVQEASCARWGRRCISEWRGVRFLLRGGSEHLKCLVCACAGALHRTPPPCRPSKQIILKLQSYWADPGLCALQPYDMGGGRRHVAHGHFPEGDRPLSPVSSLRAAQPPPQGRARHGDNPNRLQHYFATSTRWSEARAGQHPELYLAGLEALGFGPEEERHPSPRTTGRNSTLGAYLG